MISIAVVDSGALLAVVNKADPDHRRCVRVFRRRNLKFVIPALCVAEVSYLLGRRKGSRLEARFLRSLENWDVRSPVGADWVRISELVETYADFPLGGIDSSVAVLAGTLKTDLIITLDVRHFQALRTRDGKPFRLLPESG